MPIRGLQQYIEENKLFQTSPFSELNGQRVVVEGASWIRRNTNDEPFHAATGGVPMSLVASVDKAMDRLEGAGVTPLFVFAGLPTLPKREVLEEKLTRDYSLSRRTGAWRWYYQDNLEGAARDFMQSAPNAPIRYVKAVTRHLARRKPPVEFVRAPGPASPQMAWFSQSLSSSSANSGESQCSWAFGSEDLLLFGCEKVIVDWSLPDGRRQSDASAGAATGGAGDDGGGGGGGGTFTWVSLSALLENLQVTFDQFIDSCILAGCDYSTTFQTVLAQRPFKFSNASDLVRTFQTGYQTVQSAGSSGSSSSYLEDTFLPARALVRHMPVLTPPCTVRSLHPEQTPLNLKKVLGPRLPNDLYFLLSQGALDPSLVAPLVTGLVVEYAPMTNSDRYQRLMGQLVGLRCHALDVLSSSLHPQFRQVAVDLIYWHSPTTPTTLDRSPGRPLDYGLTIVPRERMPRIAPSLERLREIQKQLVTAASATAAAAAASSVASVNAGAGSTAAGSDVAATSGSAMRLALEVFQLHEQKKMVAADGNTSFVPSLATEPLKTDLETSVSLATRFLGSLGYLDLENGGDAWRRTAWGRALTLGSARFADQHMVLLELLKRSQLSPDEFSYHPNPPKNPSSEPDPATGTDTTTTTSGGAEFTMVVEVRLLTRVMSTVHMHLSALPWEGPLDQDLMAFNSLVRAMYGGLRAAVSAELVSAVLQRQTLLRPQRLYSVAAGLPFFQEASTALGIVAKHLLVKADLRPDSASMADQFPNCPQLRHDLNEGIQCWREFFQMVGFLHKELGDTVVSQDLLQCFTSADEFLSKKMKSW